VLYQALTDKGLIKMTRFLHNKNHENKRIQLSVIVFSLGILMIALCSKAYAADTYLNISLSNAIEIALKNNLEKQISFESALIAESQYQQALSARWPTLTLQAGFQHRDQAPTFTFPATNMSLPIQLGGGAIPVAEQNVKLMNQNTTTSSLQLLYPLYTGGKITSIINQANIGKEIAQEEYRRTSLQVVRDVKRYYYAAQLTKELDLTAKDILSMLSSTRDFTKGLYEGGV
jgi:outer membrane protein TolC